MVAIDSFSCVVQILVFHCQQKRKKIAPLTSHQPTRPKKPGRNGSHQTAHKPFYLILGAITQKQIKSIRQASHPDPGVPCPTSKLVSDTAQHSHNGKKKSSRTINLPKHTRHKSDRNKVIWICYRLYKSSSSSNIRLEWIILF